ncbi:glycosyltransferase [Actinomycetospora sp. NBRC 106375]|uniref:glycosyltransferase n=1 Tax=Actinomycetospora sp. NBRC 106375 TaxID=3032207 RepID=UPI002554E400|nr:glycosyltransferase [Actinomycetospora sp. NBRC 106375]
MKQRRQHRARLYAHVDSSGSDGMSSDSEARIGERILFVSKIDFRLPRDGGTLRAAAAVNVLRDAGFVVDAFAVRGDTALPRPAPAWWARLRVLISALATLSPSVLKWYSPVAVDRVVAAARHRPDLFLISFSQLAPYRRAFGGPVAFDLHNVEADIIGNYAKVAKGLLRLAASLDALFLRRLEAKIPRWADGVTAVSDNDADVFERLSGVRPAVASNGVSGDAFSLAAQIVGEPPEIVFVAHLGWRPNIDGAQWLVTAVWPHVRGALPGALLRLVGRSPAPEVLGLASHDVLIDGDVESVLPYLARARVSTAPLLAAGGTRLKIIEGLATGTPVVATRLGALGLEALVDRTFFVIADDPKVFADEIVRLAAQRTCPDVVRDSVRQYSWAEALSPLVDEVCRAIRTVASSRGSVSRRGALGLGRPRGGK